MGMRAHISSRYVVAMVTMLVFWHVRASNSKSSLELFTGAVHIPCSGGLEWDSKLYVGGF